MRVYVVLDLEVHDPELYAEYQRDVPEMIARYGGRYVTRGAPLMCLNDWKPERIVILEFPSQEDLQAFITAPEYQPLLEIRNRATTSNVVVLDGYSPA